MKRILSLLLAAAMLLSLCACGGGGPVIEEADMAVYQTYARQAAGYGKYSKSEELQRMVLRVNEDTPAYLNSLIGSLEATDLSDAGAIAILYSNYGARVLVMNKSVPTTGGEGTPVIYAYGSDGISFSTGGGSGATAEVAVSNDAYLVQDRMANLGEKSSNEIRWKLAQQELDYEAYCAKENVAKVLEQYAEQLTAIRESGEDYTLNPEWLALQKADSVLGVIGKYEREIAQTTRHLAVMVELEADTSLTDVQLVERLTAMYEEDDKITEQVEALLELERLKLEVKKYEEKGLEGYGLIQEKLDALKQEKGEEYRATMEYYLLCQVVYTKLYGKGSNAFSQYETAQWKQWLQELQVEAMDQRHAATEDYMIRYISDHMKVKLEYLNTYRTYAAKYAAATANYDKYLTEHKDEHEAYMAAAEAIKAKYEDNSYEKDMDYIKLQLTYQEFLTAVADYTTNMETIKAEMDKKLADYDNQFKKLEETREASELSAKKLRDQKKISPALQKLADEQKVETLGEPSGKDEYDAFRLMVDGETVSQWVESTPDYAKDLDGMTSTYTPPSTNTNKGSSTNTNKGSSTKKYKCLNCGKSMSYEAMYCASCLNEYFGGNYFTD